MRSIDPSPQRPFDPRFRILDQGRGLAILWVLLFHGFCGRPDMHPCFKWFLPVLTYGWLGVRLFFVISGYCIVSKVSAMGIKGQGARDFLIDRFWRLIPAYWAAVLVAVVIAMAAMPFNHTPFVHNVPASPKDWVATLFLLQRVLNAPLYVVVYWSLIVEWSFYLVMAGLMAVARWISLEQAMGVLFPVAVYLALYANAVNYWSGVVDLFCGACLYFVVRSRSESNVIKARLFQAMLAVVAIAGYWTAHRGISFTAITAATFALLLVELHRWDETLATVKEFVFLKRAGQISYSVYLIHMPVQNRILNLGVRHVALQSASYLVLQVVALIVVWGAGELFFRWVEKPFNDRRRESKVARADDSRLPSAIAA